MKKFQILLVISIYFFICSNVYANTINISSFDELMNSILRNGDTYNITEDLSSSESIGQHFFNYNIIFDGNMHAIDGNNQYGGFILNQDNFFNEIIMSNCKGQLYQNSNFAGAIFNSGGHTEIQNSNFNQNFVNTGSVQFAVAGAVYNLFGGSIDINNVSFENNYTIGAGSYGGAIANGYNDNGTAKMNISNTVFSGNYSSGDTVAYGGALYNNGIASIDSSSFNNNYVEGFQDRPEDSPFLLGGAIYNNKELTITNSDFTDNLNKGTNTSISFGGAIYNNASLTLDNCRFDGNQISTSRYGSGGAIYNSQSGNITIKNSLLQNNQVTPDLDYGEGGAVFNAGNIIFENTTLQNNIDRDNSKNDIYNTQTGKITFDGTGVNNILSGIDGQGAVIKTGQGSLNLGGKNDGFTGDFSLQSGTVNLLSDSSYFNAASTSFFNNVNFNMVNRQINDINFGALSLSGVSHIFADVNFNTNTMDRINASSISGNGSILVSGLSFEGVPSSSNISIPFANQIVKDYVRYTPSVLSTPIYNYGVSYNSSDGNFEFVRNGFSSSSYVSEVAAQLAGYLAQIDTYKNVFSNLDMVMILPAEFNKFSFQNKIVSKETFAFSPFLMPEKRNGIWFKPYSSFETVSLKNGPDVSNVSYGSIVGAESGLKKLQNGWYTIYGLYAAYNGSHQAYLGNSIYNNGGLLGLNAAFYKGNFFSAWTANVGANSAESSTQFGKDNFNMLNTGIAQLTGYNIPVLNKKLYIQPAILTSYSFINTFDYTSNSGLHINTSPLNALQVEPRLKLIGNFKDFLQPYICVSVVWNLIDNAKFKANDVYLPNLSVRPFVQYGAGVQKRFGDRVTGFFETLIRNGSRDGVALQFGIRFSI